MSKKKSSGAKKLAIKGMIGCAPIIGFFVIFIIIIFTMSTYFSSSSISDKLSAAENTELVNLAKTKSSDITSQFKDYYGTDKRFSLGYNYIIAYSKYQIATEEYNNNNKYKTKEQFKEVVNDAVDKIKPIVEYKEEKITTVREYKVKVKYFETSASFPVGIAVVEKAPQKFEELDKEITYCIDNDTTYLYKKGDTEMTLKDGKPYAIEDVSFYINKPDGMTPENYNIGKKIFILEGKKLYEVIEKEEIKRDVKVENIYLVTSAKTIDASYALTYEVKTDVKEKDGEKITTTKPVVTSMKQTDKKWDYLKAIIKLAYPNEDADKAMEIIVASALNYINKNVTEDMIFSGNGGSVNPVDFSGGQMEFVEKVAPGAKKSQEIYGVLPSITIAQSILESAWGKSGLTQKANNLFGIKSFGWPGQTIDMLTKEYDGGGSEFFISATFRAYSNWEDSIEDHSKVLLQSNYDGVRAAKTYQEAAEALRLGGYATDPAYPQLLISLIETYSLYKYDK